MEWSTIAGLLARHALTSIAGWLAAHGLMAADPSATEAFIGAGMLILGIGWSAYVKYGKALVDAAFAKKHGVASLMLIIFALAMMSEARAADMPVKAQAQPAQLSLPSCTLQQCSGFYVGANITGVGSNIDILGGGVNGSLFAGGAMMGANVGYQFWNGKVFFAFEVSGDYDTMGAASSNGRWFASEVVKLGMGLQGLFGAPTAPTTPTQSPIPISVPQSIAQALVSPYVLIGAAQRPGRTGWATGGGMDFVIAQNWNLDLAYMHVKYGDKSLLPGLTEDSENLVKLSLNYKF